VIENQKKQSHVKLKKQQIEMKKRQDSLDYLVKWERFKVRRVEV